MYYLIVAFDDPHLREKVSTDLERAGLPHSLVSTRELVQLAFTEDELDETIILFETSDVVKLVQSVFDLYELRPSGKGLPLIGMLSGWGRGWNESLAWWLIDGHAAVLSLTDFSAPMTTRGLTRLIRDEGTRPADVLLARPRRAASGECTGGSRAPDRAAGALPSLDLHAWRAKVDVPDRQLRRRILRALSEAGLDVQEVPWFGVFAERELAVVYRGKDLARLVHEVNLVRRSGKSVPGTQPVIALVPQQAFMLSPSLASWSIGRCAAVDAVTPSDVTDVSARVVGAALRLVANRAGGR